MVLQELLLEAYYSVQQEQLLEQVRQKESIVDNMSINIRVNDANNPLVSIILISEAVNTSSYIQQYSTTCTQIVTIIIHER